MYIYLPYSAELFTIDEGFQVHVLMAQNSQEMHSSTSMH